MKRTLILLSLALAGACTLHADIRLTALKVSGRQAPLGIDSTPSFSWQTLSTERGFRQQSYELAVRDASGTLVWTSGEVASALQTGIPYAGPALQSCAAYTWSVRVKGTDGASAATAESTFETAFMSPDAWSASWITATKQPNAVFEIRLDKPVTTRFLRIDATRLGLPVSTDPTGHYLQLAEVEVYGAAGKLPYTPSASSNMDWRSSWNLHFVNDGAIAGTAALGYTSQKFASADQHVWLTLDLGTRQQVSRLLLYPRQDDAAKGHSDLAANFPADFTLQQSADGKRYTTLRRFSNQRPSFAYNINNVPYYGRNFTLRGPVRRARIYASGLGVFTMRMNGQRVTDAVLEPGESEYEKSVLYSTYDVTSLLRPGRNTWLAQVAGGLYNVELLPGRFSKGEVKNAGTTGLLAELLVEYEDGTSERILTDGQWRTAPSATLGSNWWGGEDYDARRHDAAVLRLDYDVSAWTPAAVFTPHFASTQASGFGQLRSRMHEPLRVVEEWPAVDVRTIVVGGKTMHVVDFGRNFAGQFRFRLKGKPGQTITLREGESLNADGTIFMENYYTGPADTYETYTFSGAPEGEEWGPEFMYHGFRYLQIAGLDEAPDASSFTAQRIRSDVANSGTFTSSNQLLNDIHIICRDAIASQLYNSVTDCPHREKLGWLDVPNEMFNSLTYNFDMQTFFRKVVLDCFDAQYADGRVPSTVPHYMSVYDNDPNWGGAAILVPYRCWKTYADPSLITEFYPQMKRLVDYYTTQTVDGIMRNDLSVLSDWGQETAGVNPMVRPDFTITTTYYHLLRAMAEVATFLSHDADAATFARQADHTKAAFNRRFYGNVAPGLYGNGQQGELAMPLYYGLVDEANEADVAARLAARVEADGFKIKTGEIALKPLFMSLARFGYNDIVYRMANQTDCPSYGYWVVQGYTTTPEYWDVGEFSQNHCMMDHIEEWFFSELGGIKTSDNGFAHISIAPWLPADMTSLDTQTGTNYGPISVSYKRNGKTVDYTIDVPANTTATIALPLRAGQHASENGRRLRPGQAGISSVRYADGKATIDVGSGTYRFTTPDQ